MDIKLTHAGYSRRFKIHQGMVPTVQITISDLDWYLTIQKQDLEHLIYHGLVKACPILSTNGESDATVDCFDAVRAYVHTKRGYHFKQSAETIRKAVEHPELDSPRLITLLGNFAIGLAWSRQHQWTFTLRPLAGFTASKRFEPCGRATAKLMAYALGRLKN